MSRAAKGTLLLVLLAGIIFILRILATGQTDAWSFGLSPVTAARLFRALTIGLGLCAWFLSQSLIAARGMSSGPIGDAVHDWTAPAHAWLARNVAATNALLVASSGCIDLFGLFLLGSSLLGPTMRPGVALLILFAFRQIAQLTCALPTPPGMIWRHPGVPSLLVTYDVGNDFFFSGHTAIAVLGAIEIAHAAPLPVAIAVGVVAGLEALTVLVLRAHYTMDIIAGALAAAVAAELGRLVCVGF